MFTPFVKMRLVGVDMVSMGNAQNRRELMGRGNWLRGDETTIRILKRKTLPLLVGADRFQSHTRRWRGSGCLLLRADRVEAKLRALGVLDDGDFYQAIPGLDERAAVGTRLQRGVFMHMKVGRGAVT